MTSSIFPRCARLSQMASSRPLVTLVSSGSVRELMYWRLIKVSGMFNYLAAALISFGVILACAPVRSDVPTVPVNTDFDVAVKGMARIQDSWLLVRFDTVTDDSRCPADVQCVWEGNATARVTVDSAGISASAEFRTARLEPVRLFGWTLELRQLRPARTTQTAPKPDDYVVTLRASR